MLLLYTQFHFHFQSNVHYHNRLQIKVEIFFIIPKLIFCHLISTFYNINKIFHFFLYYLHLYNMYDELGGFFQSLNASNIISAAPIFKAFPQFPITFRYFIIFHQYDTQMRQVKILYELDICDVKFEVHYMNRHPSHGL